MAISPLAVKQFLQRESDDHTWMKALTKEEVRAALIDVDPLLGPLSEGMMLHQLVGMLLGVAYEAFAYWYGMGIGKTLIALRLLEYWHTIGRIEKALVLAVSNEAVYTWGDEVRKWRVKLPYIELAEGATSVEKAERMIGLERGIVIASYPGFRTMVSAKRPETKKGALTGRRELKATKSGLDAVCDGVGALILDESTEVAHRDSLNYAVCNDVAKRVGIRLALAGRPFGRDPAALWPQQFLVDRGASLGPTLGLFREAFFTKKKSYFGGPYSFDYTFDKSNGPALAKFSGHRSLQYSTEECVDLPAKNYVQKNIPFSAETIEYYDRVVQHLISARGDKAVRQSDFVRLRQLSSGFLGVANDEFGAKVEIEFKRNPKLDTLMELLGQIPVGRKSVVFFEFIHSGKLLHAALKKAKIKHSWIWSGAKDRKAQMDRFRDDPDCEVLLLNHQIGAYSLNLQHANYVFFFESPVGCIDRDQAERRCWRTGQLLRVTIFDLVMVGGVEERIRQFHKEGADIYASMARTPSLLLRQKAA